MIMNTSMNREVDTLIIGVGFAGLYLAHVLQQEGHTEFLLIGPDTNTPSNKSYYQFRSRGMRQDSLRKTILTSGRNKNNAQLVSVLVHRIDDELTRLSEITTLKPSFVGVTPVNPRALLDRLREESKEKRIIGEVISAKKYRGNIRTETTVGTIACKRLVFCTGGMRSRLSLAFQDEQVNHDPFSIARGLACKMKDLDRAMIHPFYSGGVCIPTDNLFGYSIVGKDGMVLPKTNSLIASHNAHFHFKEILDEMQQVGAPCFAVRGSIRIPLNPTVHSVLGGIVIDKHGRTNIQNVYALGECSYGMHGIERVGGASLSEIIVMARVIGRSLIKTA